MIIYKAQFRFPTEQFAYMEVSAEGTPEELKTQYDAFERLLKVGVGLETKEWNRVLDEVLETGKLEDGANLWERMDKEQQLILQEIKKSIKRRNYENHN